MDKLKFLNEVVFGYIKKDLVENLKSYLPKKPGEAGNNNFTIALCVLSYMEYLGSFFTLDDFNFDNNVRIYLDKCFAHPSEYHPSILGDLFRNGLAHDYFARGGVARDENRPALYRNYDNKVILDADTLLNDFLVSLDKFSKELTDENFEKRIEMAMRKIDAVLLEHDSEIKQLPFIGNIKNLRTSGATILPEITTTTLPYENTKHTK